MKKILLAAFLISCVFIGYGWAWYMTNQIKADDYANQYEYECKLKRDKGEACL